MRKASPLISVILENKAQLPGFALITLSAGVTAVCKYLTAFYWGRAVDLGMSGQLNDTILAIGLMIFFVFINATKGSLHFWIVGRTVESLFIKLKMRAFRVLVRGDVAALEKNIRSGDIAMRINSDTEYLCDTLSGNFSFIVGAILQFSAGVIGCAVLSWQLLIAYVAILPFTMWLMKKMGDPIREQRRAASMATGSAMDTAVGAFSGMATVKSFGLEGEMAERFAHATDASYQQSVRTEKINARMNIVKQVVTVSQIMILFLVGTALLSFDMLSLGNLLAFIAASSLISDAVVDTDRMVGLVNSASAAASRLYDIYAIPLERDGSGGIPDLQGDAVKADHLSFAYAKDMDILTHMNLRVQKNQKVGVIGPSGCGKSTLVKLFCGFYRPSEGELSMFGQPIDSISLDALRGEIALMNQDASLFDGSVYENVLYGRPGATEEEVMSAIRSAQLEEVVASMPDGVHTQVGEYGSRLSGGQRQRVGIARALLKNARLLILDEATSALDTETEAELQSAMECLFAGRAVIVVAHRLTTVRNMDYLYCMDHGRIVEEGTPAELLRAKGYYYSMCARQGLLAEGEG